MRFLSILLLSFLLSSCAGYQFVVKENPFAKHHITSLAIPQFINRSATPAIAALSTQEFISMISEYSGLRLVEGEGSKADGVLIGIVKGPVRRDQAQRVKSLIYTGENLKKSLGTREGLYLPGIIEGVLEIQILLIRRPTEKFEKKVIFDKSYTMTSEYSLVAGSANHPDDAGTVNATKNSRLFIRNLENLAKNAAKRFQNEIVDAF